MTHLSHSAVPIVGHGLHQHSDPTRRVAFVGEFLHVVVLGVASTASDSAINRVAGHIGAERLIHRRTQTRVILDHAAALLGSDGQFTNELGEELAALGILSCLAVLNVGPFTVSCHGTLQKRSTTAVFIWPRACARGCSTRVVEPRILRPEHRSLRSARTASWGKR